MEPAAHQTIMSFTRDLALKVPAPGGGAAGAVSASIAAALAGMVVSFSVGKKSLAEHQGRLEKIGSELNVIRRRALELADEDAAAYTRLNRLQKLPKTDEHRDQQLAGAAMTALNVPAELVQHTARVAELLEELSPISNPHLRADLVSAAAINAGASATGLEMVKVNAPSAPEQSAGPVLARATDQADRCAGVARALAAGG